MIDLISRNQNELTPDEITQLNIVINKYSPALKEILKFDNKLVPYVAHIIDIGVNYVNDKHSDLDADWKIWCIVLLKNLFLDHKLTNIDDVPKLVDDFVMYYNDEHAKFKKTIEVSASNYDKDYIFVISYVNNLAKF